jgi:hypothetical protein
LSCVIAEGRTGWNAFGSFLIFWFGLLLDPNLESLAFSYNRNFTFNRNSVMFLILGPGNSGFLNRSIIDLISV